MLRRFSPGLLHSLALLFLLTPLSAFGVPVRSGYSKVVFRHIVALPNATAPARIVKEVDGSILQEYDASVLASIPATRAERLRALALEFGLDAEVRDDFDLIRVPIGRLDSRKGAAGSFPGRYVSPPLAYGVPGLHVLQFIGPVLPEWLAAVRSVGITPVQYLTFHAFIAAGTGESFSAANQFPFVQYSEVLSPFLKPQFQTTPGVLVDTIVQVANVSGASDVITQLRRLSASALRVTQWSAEELQVTGTFDGSSVQAILETPLVFGVSRVPRFALSDERVGTSLSPYVSGGQPLNPGGQPGAYKAWLQLACSFCDALQADGFWVGIADIGVAGGNTSDPTQYHPDLPMGRFKWGTDFTPLPQAGFSDPNGHGTFVAAVLGGDPPGGAPADSGQYHYGSGVAPSVGILESRILPTSVQLADIERITDDALKQQPPVKVQSHSFNEYGAPCYSGWYSMVSRNYDKAAIDGQPTVEGEQPITLVVSAGNQTQDAANGCDANERTLPPATAKNVIAAGMAETARPDNWNCVACGRQSFDNIAAGGKRGTQNPGWFKPDLFVPSANISSARSTIMDPNQLGAWNLKCTPPVTPPDGYIVSSGTSFAAPAIAGAAILARRVYAEHLTPDCRAQQNCAQASNSASPALVKAMLIASAHSMADGTSYSYSGTTTTPIGGFPNDRQGFGRASLVDLFSAYPAHYYLNETFPFTAPDQVWYQTLTVHDPTLPVKVVLVWTDKPALQDSGPPVMTDAPLLHDLDLSVRILNGSTCVKQFSGNNLTWSQGQAETSVLQTSCIGGTFDRKNNVEVIQFTPGLDSTITTFQVKVYFDSGALAGGETQKFALVAYNAYASDDAPPAVPVSVSATATSTAAINVTWAAASGAAAYEIQRSDGVEFTSIGTSTATSFTDTGVAPASSHLYRVRATRPTTASGWSTPDVATTINFDETFAQSQTARASHLFDLRKGVLALCDLAGVAQPVFTDSAVTSSDLVGLTIKRAHIAELRSAIDVARTHLGLPAAFYSDVITANETSIKFQQFNEIWSAFK